MGHFRTFLQQLGVVAEGLKRLRSRISQLVGRTRRAAVGIWTDAALEIAMPDPSRRGAGRRDWRHRYHSCRRAKRLPDWAVAAGFKIDLG